MFKTLPNFQEVNDFRIYLNVGSLLDIPNGNYIKGLKNENILNGGLGPITAIVGKGNTFKSTIAHYFVLSASSKISSNMKYRPYISTYDTEINMQKERLLKLSKLFDEYKNINIFKERIWSITDKTLHTGNEWFRILKDFLKNEKIRNSKNYTFKTPFVGSDKKQLEMLFPTFGEIDSISEFETSEIEEIYDKSDIGDSSTNTLHMKLGLIKTRLLMELPVICNQSNHYLVLTAHLGQEINIQSTPYQIPTKKLQYLKAGEKIKGVSDKFFFLPNIVWQTVSSSTLINQNTKGPEYPYTKDDVDEGSTDLNIVTLRQLRSKSGPSGIEIDLIVSQSEGVLDYLSEFHYIKQNSRYGLEGNNINYHLVFYPKVSLSRTTVRSLLREDKKLRRAVKFTSDLLQIKNYYSDQIEIPDIKELYSTINKKYGFDKFLETRDYWTFDQYENDIPFFSTMDLLELYYGRYTPYFLK